MVAGEIFEVGVQQLVARSNHEGRSQLERSLSWRPLAVSAHQRPAGGNRCPGSHHRGQPECLGSHHLGRLAVGVEQHREGNPLFLDEGECVAFASGADGGHFRPGGKQLLVSIADLTGPLAAGQSTKVAQKQQNVGSLPPEVPKAMELAGGILQHHVTEERNVETHDAQAIGVAM